MAAMIIRGYTVADMDKMTLGMCLNAIKAYDRAYQRSHGIDVPDPEEQYMKLKRIEKTVEKKYAEGKISEERYRSYRYAIEEYEKGGI